MWKLAKAAGSELASTASFAGLVLAGMIDLVTFAARVDRLYGFAYGVVRGATGYGEPPTPSAVDGSFDPQAFDEGAAEGVRKILGDDKLRNGFLLYIASKSDDDIAAARAVLQEVWVDLIEKKIDGPAKQALQQWQLAFPDPGPA